VLASLSAALLVGACLAGVLLVAVPSSAVRVTTPLTCPGGELSSVWWSESGRLGAVCVRPGVPPVDIADRAFAVLTAVLTLPVTVLFYGRWRGPSAASKAWDRRWQR
jgi:hypothetical protein